MNHKNFDRADNRPENLEWVTRKENIRYTDLAGRRGRWPHAKIDRPTAIQMRADGLSLGAIARHFGCSVSAVSRLLKRHS